MKLSEAEGNPVFAEIVISKTLEICRILGVLVTGKTLNILLHSTLGIEWKTVSRCHRITDQGEVQSDYLLPEHDVEVFTSRLCAMRDKVALVRGCIVERVCTENALSVIIRSFPNVPTGMRGLAYFAESPFRSVVSCMVKDPNLNILQNLQCVLGGKGKVISCMKTCARCGQERILEVRSKFPTPLPCNKWYCSLSSNVNNISNCTEMSQSEEDVIDCVCGDNCEFGAMFDCDICKRWFHNKCLKFPEDRSPVNYICHECK